MRERTVDLRGQAVPLLDLVSYGRRGPGHRPLLKTEIDHISRTVRRVPEVTIKVSGGARTLRGVEEHLAYIGREGEGEVETDDGQRLREKGFERELLKDWDLDLEARQWHTQRAIATGRKPPKLVHNLVFSMPRGTPADKLLQAVRVFAREKFALQHRYGLTLHTDQGHPHVHVVVKEANATERAVRGQTKSPKRDGIHRAALRGDSTHHWLRGEAVAQELARGGVSAEPGKARLISTRQAVVNGWTAVADLLHQQGYRSLSVAVRQFANRMPPPNTDKERCAEQQLAAARGKPFDVPWRMP